eukprot:TRINITY_DN875_c0_g1_i1.p1 TRINITY_DN875_c0_g1~~TRINITY_DN875_c0_g1_i1.p1  ORF type:complete len:135 (+),score=73.68 TRINITY_DN875_c0_g1_i1:105-509(+)
MAGIRTDEESLDIEQQRLAKTFQQKHQLDINTLDDSKVVSPDFIIFLKDLPAEAGASVQLFIDRNKVYDSEDITADISTEVHHPGKYSDEISVCLKIQVMGFETTRKFAYNGGRFICFAATETGLSFKQQNTTF